MNRVKLPLSPICVSHVHCTTCRDRAGGRSWRASLAAAYALPDAAPDFTCPHGYPWGYVRDPAPPQRPPMPIPEGFDPATERRGCCDPPDPSMRR